MQDFLLAQKRLRLSVVAGGIYDRAEEKQWNLFGLFAGLEARHRPAEWLTLWGQGTFHYQDHFDSENYPQWPGKRTDRLFSAACGVNFSIHDHLALGLSYRYMNNDSLEPFTYDRHMVSLAVFTNL